MQKRALITGVGGQDGSYLAELLIAKGYEVYGMTQGKSGFTLGVVPDSVRGHITVLTGDLRDRESLDRVIETANPDEVYNLAAQSDVGASFKIPEETEAINFHGFGNLVNVSMVRNPAVRIFQASTSEMFGGALPPQDEHSSFAPTSPYGWSKLRAHQEYVVGYRERYGLAICSGFLFNHESPRRGMQFVTRKITSSLARISLGLQSELQLGNLDAKRDWGFAGDYVRAMWLMLQGDVFEDYVVATGQMHSVREFVLVAGNVLGMSLTFSGSGIDEVARDPNGKIVLRINPEFYRPIDSGYLQGDSTKAKERLGWVPEVSFNDLIVMMVEEDVRQLKYGTGV